MDGDRYGLRYKGKRVKCHNWGGAFACTEPDEKKRDGTIDNIRFDKDFGKGGGGVDRVGGETRSLFAPKHGKKQTGGLRREQFTRHAGRGGQPQKEERILFGYWAGEKKMLEGVVQRGDFFMGSGLPKRMEEDQP